MRSTRIVSCVAGVVGLALAGCAPGGGTGGGNVFAKVTQAGTEVELAHWAYWDNNCEGEAFTVTTTAAPANGRVEPRPSVFAIPEVNSAGNRTGCVDKIVESTRVFYVPNPGFRGEDRVTVQFAGSTGIVTNNYVVTVQ